MSVRGRGGPARVDFDDFYTHRQVPTGDPGDVLVLSCDGKGVVMRPGALRTPTARAAAKTNPKLQTRLVQGREAQPQTDGRAQRRLRRHPRPPHPQRIPGSGSTASTSSPAATSTAVSLPVPAPTSATR